LNWQGGCENFVGEKFDLGAETLLRECVSDPGEYIGVKKCE